MDYKDELNELLDEVNQESRKPIKKNLKNIIKKYQKKKEKKSIKKAVVKQSKNTYKKVLKITFGDLATIRGVSRATIRNDRYKGKFSFDDILSVARYILRIK